MAVHACSPDLHHFVELVSPKTSVVLSSLPLGCRIKFSACADSCWVVCCGSADRSSRPVLICLKEEMSCFSSAETECPHKWMNWFRSVLQENNNRNTSQNQNWLRDSPSSFWIRYLELLFLAPCCSLLSQTSYHLHCFCLLKYLPSPMWLWFELTKKNEATSHPCKCTQEGKFLHIGSFGSSESLTGLKQQKWFHRATGCASKTTDLEESAGVPFLLGLLRLSLWRVGLMSNSTSACVEMCLIRGKNIFCYPNQNFDYFQEVMKYWRSCRSCFSFFFRSS